MCGLKRRRKMAGEAVVKQMEGAKEIAVPTLTRRYFPSKGTGQVGPIRMELVRGIPLKI